ncbi:Tn3 family transposase [Legionella tunisiensis]|uniref:Tn3 family transposase n=1 Tax=Legionella tunisiensis TaxID=1034944 RepID=UPI00036455DE
MANMTNVINEMKAESYEIIPEMLNGLSPYHTSHLNRFGLFPLTGSREKLRVEYKLN